MSKQKNITRKQQLSINDALDTMLVQHQRWQDNKAKKLLNWFAVGTVFGIVITSLIKE